jgi:CheY-like chemotaxis protein/anti-sigma regulatory factor (Ser/Thr protein kinase)
VVRSAVEATRSVVSQAEHELFVTLPGRPIYLECDATRLTQILSNLLTNAAKYTPHGGRIWLSATLEGTEAVMVVKDNGIGIPADMLESIFDMFTQVDRSLERSFSGLGIGLTLVKRLVEMHLGHIEVKSGGENQGSELLVYLPALNDDDPLEIVEPLASPGPAEMTGKCRVLVVDDNKSAASMMSMVIKLLGHDVRTAHDGLEAVELAGDFLPQIVLMDLGMPKLNGYEAARRIRNQSWGRNMILVALTGWGQEEDKQRTREAGFDHHLIKPVEPAELRRILALADEA